MMFPDHVGDPLRHLLYAVGVLAMVIAFGTFGYMIIEGWSVFDGLHMTVTTVGYREVNPLSAAGGAFTIGLILAGVGTLFYVLGNFARFVLEGELRQVFGRYRSGRIRLGTGHSFPFFSPDRVRSRNLLTSS